MAGIDDVAFNRLDDTAGCIGAIVLDIFDRFFAGPAFVVQSAVNHQANRAVQFELQPAKIARRIGIKAHVLCQLLRIKTPAFGISGDAAKLAEGGHVFQLGLNRKLQMVAGNALMVK